MRWTARPLAAAVLAGGALAGVGCGAARPPVAKMVAADVAVREAEESGAIERAPLELSLAREELDHATRAMENEEYDDAQRLAERAYVDAQVAESKAEAEDTGVQSGGEARRAARERELAALHARRTDRGIEITLGDARFATGGATLEPGGERLLAKLAAILRDDPTVRMLIEGHTDDRGGTENDTGLSDERANAVRDFLVARGIAPEQIVANGYGEAYPIASNDTEAGRRQNRRVEIIVAPRDSVARPQSAASADR